MVRGIDEAWLGDRVREASAVSPSAGDEVERLRELLVRCAEGFRARRPDVASARVGWPRRGLGADEARSFLRAVAYVAVRSSLVGSPRMLTSLAFEATGHPVIDRPSPEADVHEVLDQVRRRQVILDHRFGCQREQSGVLRSSQKQSSVWNLHDVIASSASRTLGSRCARRSAE